MTSRSSNDRASSRHLMIPLVCLIGVASGIIIGRIMRYEYEALNRIYSRYSLEDDGWVDLILCALGFVASLILCFSRIRKLSLSKALIITCITFTGGCLGILMAQVATYNGFIILVGYIAGAILGNLISRDFGL